MLSHSEIADVLAHGSPAERQYAWRAACHPYYTFTPRENAPERFDEQSAFVDSDALVSICLGGNGSGKTAAGALKCARFVLEKQPPPREDTPFWIISDSYDQSCGVCWFEKLRTLLPAETVDWDRITWYRSTRGWPYSVPLRPWTGRPGKNWVLEFKSYEQGRDKMQSASIGGAWFSEQFPPEIFTEVLRGCRDYMFAGGVWAEFTPIDPDKSVAIEEWYDKPPAGYSFFHTNTDLNTAVSDEWREAFFAAVSDEMQDVRKIGAFASYEGQIYQVFNPKIHLVDNLEVQPGTWHRRAIDWGSSTEHPFVCVWGARDATGRWFIYDEYWDNSQTRTIDEKVQEITERQRWPADAYHGTTYADPSRPDLMLEFARRGIQISPASNAVLQGIECVRSALKMRPAIAGCSGETGLYIDRERCPYLAKQLRTYRWLRSTGKGANPRAARPEPLKKDDDAVDALRYLLYSDSASRGQRPTPLRIDKGADRHGVRFHRDRNWRKGR